MDGNLKSKINAELEFVLNKMKTCSADASVGLGQVVHMLKMSKTEEDYQASVKFMNIQIKKFKL